MSTPLPPTSRDDPAGSIYPVPYRPWFLAVTAKGRLFQAWMAAFFLLTAWTVSGGAPSQTPVFGLPGSMGWIYAGEIATIGVLGLTYLYHWRPAARAADRQVQRIQEDHPTTGRDEETES